MIGILLIILTFIIISYLIHMVFYIYFRNNKKIDDNEIDFDDRKTKLDIEKKKNENRKEIMNWLKKKNDYLKSI